MPITPINAVVANRTRSMSFQVLADFYNTVILALTGNLTFPTPIPSLVTAAANQAAFQNAILVWGGTGSRGSHAQYVALLVAQAQVLIDLDSLAGYVQATSRAAFPGDYNNQSLAILSAGMRVKNPSNSLASWGAVNNFRQLLKQNLQGSGYINLRWSKPNVLPGAMSKPPAYNIYYSPDDIVAFVLYATTSSTGFLYTASVQGQNAYFKIAPVSAAGEGVISPALSCFGQ